MESRIAYRINVTGRVQGVGFRYSVQQRASRLRLGGWVRNEGDGSVEIHCEGASAAVDVFIEWIEAGGPSYCRIDYIQKHPVSPQGVFTRFTVEY
ncbi:MAG: acylphosphatase [Spirochaetales bacterium]|nr:acylphosphatase [Spirochaetales bacterium]